MFDREKLGQKDLLEKLALWGFKDLLERVVLRDYVEYLVLLWVHFVLEYTYAWDITKISTKLSQFLTKLPNMSKYFQGEQGLPGASGKDGPPGPLVRIK